MMFSCWLFLLSVYGVWTTPIAKIDNSIYTPQSPTVNTSLTTSFVVNCYECLCRAFSSNAVYSMMNCEKNARWCSLYRNLSTNYTITPKLNSSVYILQSSLIASLATYTTSTSAQTTSLGTTSQPFPPNVWLQVGNMTVARYYHASAYIPETGNVLLAGATGLSSMEMFVSSNWTFVKRRNMSQSRLTPSMDRLSANSMLIAAVTNADLYDPVTDTINRTVNMSVPRISFQSTVIVNNGSRKVLLTGGRVTDGSWNFLSSAELYNPATQTFQLITMPNARYYHTTTVLPNNNILLAGGTSVVNVPVNSLLLYNTSSNTFSTLTATMSTVRYYHTETYIPSIQSILLAGGYYSGSNLISYDLFNVTTMTVVRNGTMKFARCGHTATLLSDGQVLIVGSDPATNTAELFDPATLTFRYAANLTVARGYHTATFLQHSGQVLVCGGYGIASALASCELYQP